MFPQTSCSPLASINHCQRLRPLTWLSILISVSVSLSRKASTRACIPAPVMKLDSKLRLCSALLARSMSLNACEEVEEEVEEEQGVSEEVETLWRPARGADSGLSPQPPGRCSASPPC